MGKAQEKLRVPWLKNLSEAGSRKLLALLLLAVHDRVALQCRYPLCHGLASSWQIWNTAKMNSWGLGRLPHSRRLCNKKASPRSAGALMRIADKFERSALAGIWSCHLDLDDGVAEVSIFLNDRGSGTASTRESTLALMGRLAWKVEIDDASDNDCDSDLSLQITVKLGNFELQGVGRRTNGSLQCQTFAGYVLEGDADPFCVGRFDMRLTLPEADDMNLRALEEKHARTQQSKSSLPARFRFHGFPGRWRLFVALDDFQALCEMELDENGRFSSIDSKSSGIRLTGTWGLFDSMAVSDGLVDSSVHGKWGPRVGTHLWLHVQRDQCVGLPKVKDSFSLMGVPEVSSLQAELEANSYGGSDHFNNVNGYCYYPGVADRYRYIAGRFALTRVDDCEDAF